MTRQGCKALLTAFLAALNGAWQLSQPLHEASMPQSLSSNILTDCGTVLFLGHYIHAPNRDDSLTDSGPMEDSLALIQCLRSFTLCSTTTP